MKHSLEHLGSSRNMDISNDEEGIKKAEAMAKNPPSFEEHMRELKELIDSLPTDNDEEVNKAIENLAREQAIKDARAAVMQSFHKSPAPKAEDFKDNRDLSEISATF